MTYGTDGTIRVPSWRYDPLTQAYVARMPDERFRARKRNRPRSAWPLCLPLGTFDRKDACLRAKVSYQTTRPSPPRPCSVRHG